MIKAFTIHSTYNEINGDYFEHELCNYGDHGFKKSYRNKDSNIFIFYNKFYSIWYIHEEYNTFLQTNNKSNYTGFGVLHAIGYLSDDLVGQWHYSNDNLHNRSGPISNIDKSIPKGYILSKA